MKNTRSVTFCAKPFMGLNKPLSNGMKNSSHMFYKLVSLKVRLTKNFTSRKPTKKQFLGLYVDDSILVTNNEKH
jgi:hypothetical protein